MLYSRNKHNIVNQLSFNLKKNKNGLNKIGVYIFALLSLVKAVGRKIRVDMAATWESGVLVSSVLLLYHP